MEVFIGNLPGQATLLDLRNFLQGIEVRMDFQYHQGRDRQDRNYHFVVARTANPDEGRALIDKLNGRLFEGRPIEAREYRPRASRAPWKGAERRLNSW